MNNRKKMIPISRPVFSARAIKLVKEVLDSGWVMQGPKVEEFEEKIAKYVGSRYAIAASSGTTALHLALLASGIGQGDEVLVPSYSFIASANSILYVDAKPVFLDIDPDTFNLDPDKIEDKITKKTKAILVVHQFGLPADMDTIAKISDKHGLKVIEDAACALGSSFKGRRIGSGGRIACFSFHPRKIISTGEGGLITTADAKIAQKVRALRSHGIKGDRGVMLGYNYRMTDVQAALGIEQLERLGKIINKRKNLAFRYGSRLKDAAYLDLPFLPDYVTEFNYQSYAVKINKRLGKPLSHVIDFLYKRGISARRGVAPIHLEPYYQKRFGRIRLSATEEAYRTSFLIPLYESLAPEAQDRVIKALLLAAD